MKIRISELIVHKVAPTSWSRAVRSAAKWSDWVFGARHVPAPYQLRAWHQNPRAWHQNPRQAMVPRRGRDYAGSMLYVDLFRDPERSGGFHRLSSANSEKRTIELAQLELLGARFPWARAFEVVNGEGDILAVGIRKA